MFGQRAFSVWFIRLFCLWKWKKIKDLEVEIKCSYMPIFPCVKYIVYIILYYFHKCSICK